MINQDLNSKSIPSVSCTSSWDAFLAQIRPRLSPVALNNWILPIKLAAESESELVLEVPNIFVKEYLLSNYKDLLEQCFPEKEIRFNIVPPAHCREKLPDTREQDFISTLPIKFRDAKLDNASMIPEDQKEYGRKWALNPSSLIISGDVGRGKTYYCYSILREAKRQNMNLDILHYCMKDLDTVLLHALREGSDYKVMNDLKRADLLFLDDLGRETKSDRMSRQLYEFINYRYANEKVTLVTTNFTIADISATICPAVASRLSEWQIIKMNGKDLRQII